MMLMALYALLINLYMEWFARLQHRALVGFSLGN